MITRKTLQFIHKDEKYEVQQLFPYDFMNSYYWPFSYYHINKFKSSDITKVEIKRDWKLKPNQKLSEDKESHVNNVLYTKGITNKFFTFNSEDDEVKHLLFVYIFCATYNLDVESFILSSGETFTKEMLIMCYYKSKSLNVEPYALITNINEELPELYNPKRYDFNLLVLNTGISEENERMSSEMKKYNRRVQ